MKKLLLLLIFALVLGLISGAAVAQDDDPIQIGASLPLTGSFSIPGTKHQDGYQHCVNLINERGGLLDRQVELIVSDNQSDAEVAIAQFERFIDAGGGSGGNRGTADSSGIKGDFDFDRGVTAGIDNLTGIDIENIWHG